VEDFNADGKLDLAFIDSSDNVSILLGTGTGSFGTPTKFKAGNDPIGLATGDFNGDNKPDLAVTNIANLTTYQSCWGQGKAALGLPLTLMRGTFPIVLLLGTLTAITNQT
jgi:hypothetical protein